MISLRPATEADIPDLSRLATKVYTEAFGHAFEGKEELKEALERGRSEQHFKKALQEGVVLVAEEEKLIGYAEFNPANPTLKGVEAGDQELYGLFVLFEYQNKGIGSQLLEAALKYPQMQAAKHIFLTVWEENMGAQKLYKRYGFIETGERADEDEIIMVRTNF